MDTCNKAAPVKSCEAKHRLPALCQPVEAAEWIDRAEVEVKESSLGFFYPSIETPGNGFGDKRTGLKVKYTRTALRHAFDYCTAHKMRIGLVKNAGGVNIILR